MSSNIGINASTEGDGESMPNPTRKYMSTLTHSPPDDENNVYDEELAQTIVDSLLADQVAIIFGFLNHKQIMRARVCTTWRDAAKKTLVSSCFDVRDSRSYNAMRAMTSALPNLQEISIHSLGQTQKYADGEDPDEEWIEMERLHVFTDTDNYTPHDISLISNFRKLQILDLVEAPLNGRYPVLFNFPMLQILKISGCSHLKWDLDMLSGCPLLKELWLEDQSSSTTGDLKSLRVLKNTLVKVSIDDCNCYNIRGNFMELADFPCLKELWICDGCPVTGDIRDIQEDDFPSLEELCLPDTVIGGGNYKFQRIRDVPRFMQAIYPLLKRSPKEFNYMCWSLSRDSPDWYESELGGGCPEPPFEICLVLSGGLRMGWRWSALGYGSQHACEVNWLDPEPSKDCDDYDKYVECLQNMGDDSDFYRGYYEPPTEEEYRRLCLRDRED